MNCERFQMVAADLARNQVMEASERTSAQAHVGECVDCRKALSDQQELNERLRLVTEQMRSSRAPEHLEQKVLAAFRDQSRVRSIQSARTLPGYWLTAAAAILLIVIGLLAWRWNAGSVRPAPVQANSNGAPAERETPKQELSPDVAVSGIEPLPGSPPRRTSPRRHRPTLQLAKHNYSKRSVEPAAPLATNTETDEVATDFVPIGYGSAADLQYGGQMVRVELPRSVLARFGLPMNMNRVDERVKADVLVGSDGFARAIRFVKEIN